eukprot:481657-Heterocapsa_arctica.AAC.1
MAFASSAMRLMTPHYTDSTCVRHAGFQERRLQAPSSWMLPCWLGQGLSILRGIFSHPGSLWPGPEVEDSTIFLIDGVQSEEARTMEGNIYVDGACHPNNIPSLRRAGWAVVQEGAGQECKIQYGPVWHPLPQTAQAAEWVAWAVAHQFATGSAVLHSDCSNVNNSHEAPPASQSEAQPPICWHYQKHTQ